MTGKAEIGDRSLEIGKGAVSVLPALAALQFLTLAPPLVRRPFTLAEMGQAVGYFPLVGTLLGGILAGLSWGLALTFPASIASVLTLAVWITVTGALHLDGLLDACDGVFGGRDPEMRLSILRDERVGAFAVVGGVLLLLTKYAALGAISNATAALLLAPTLGRWGMVLAIAGFPYARPEGLGRAMKDRAGWPQLMLATGVALLVAWFASHRLGLIALTLAAGATWLIARFTLSRLPGLTGDIYGATCEIVETVVLLAFVAGGGL